MAPTVQNAKTWVRNNEEFFKPPICNKMMYKDGQLQAFFVGGPNTRTDFHIEEGEEFFYQLKGKMNLIVNEQGQLRDLFIDEGEIFLLPRYMMHSPRRFENTLGLVIERRRLLDEMDCMRYLVDGTTTTLYERWFHLDSLDSQLPVLIREYHESEQFKTGKPIPGTITDNPPFKADSDRLLDSPFSLKKWIENNREEIISAGQKPLFEGDYISRINVIGPGRHSGEAYLPETFLLQLEGKSVLTVEGKDYSLSTDDTALIPEGESWSLNNNEDSFTLSVVMDPNNV